MATMVYSATSSSETRLYVSCSYSLSKVVSSSTASGVVTGATAYVDLKTSDISKSYTVRVGVNPHSVQLTGGLSNIYDTKTITFDVSNSYQTFVFNIPSMTVDEANTLSTVWIECTSNNGVSLYQFGDIDVSVNYTPITAPTAPTSLYFQGYTGNVPDAELNTQYILLWSGATGSISGYEVYRSTTPDGYSLWYTVSSDSSGIAITTPNTNSTTWSFMVRAVGTDGSYSSFAGPISITTKAAQVFTNYGISYSNGTQWLYPTPQYYNGTRWIIPTMWYYDGSEWLPIPPRPKCSATVEDVSSAMYGFKINDNGYHESQNKGVGSSYALCKVKIVTDGTQAVYVDCINYAESTYDYGILSKIDTALSLSIGADSTDKVQRTFSGSHSASVQTVDYGVLSAGEHYIYIKYIKDSRDDYNNDSLQFKVRFGSQGSGCSATVASVSGAYNFAMNGSGYYESTNKGDDYHGTYALCRVNIVADGVKRMYVDYINYGENGWDYGLISKLDTTLGADDTKTSTNIHESFVVASNSSVQTLDYGVLSAGEHYIYAKYLKDGSYNNGSDSLQFKVRFV